MKAASLVTVALLTATCFTSSALGQRSLHSDVPVSLTVTNSLHVQAEMYWVDFQGREVSYGELQPGESRTLTSYASHPWIFRAYDARGRQLVKRYVCSFGTRQDFEIRRPTRSVTIDDLAGRYVHQPYENGYHAGTLTVITGQYGYPVLLWSNRAGVEWRLQPNSQLTKLLTGTNKNPYYYSNPLDGRSFDIVYRQTPNGKEVAGFTFLSAFYRKVD